jgi:RNA polymerase sigma factor (sigma-70 family)
MAPRPTARRDRDRNARLVDYLARERWRWLCAVARRWGVEGHAVDDVVQSALLDVLRSFPGPDDSRHVAAYAARCVQTEAWKLHRRHARKEGRWAPLPERERNDRLGGVEQVEIADPESADPLESVIDAEATDEALIRLEELPDDQRAVVLLRAAGFESAEIAARLELSLRGVRKRIEKANRRLRDL